MNKKENEVVFTGKIVEVSEKSIKEVIVDKSGASEDIAFLCLDIILEKVSPESLELCLKRRIPSYLFCLLTMIAATFCIILRLNHYLSLICGPHQSHFTPYLPKHLIN
ncbi:unnamed protein product [Brassica rapa]|uniref:Uncharacterized protein n=2 Tax=Brassica TaxID=3705 RepID=A0A3P5ZS01_BRACM|nr:unnamed protein product [Brassica napus]CAG7887282.1 unnamed protein product [Brassica rapa]VDC74798.1 unnamed protein product [Brassica rapa]